MTHRLGTPSRVLGAAVALVGAVELLFGRGRIGHLPGPIHLPFPAGVPVGIIANGLVIGTLYALVALGLILVYRADRLISFAQVGLGAVPAVLGLLLVTDRHVSYWVAAVVMLAGAALVGALVEVVVMRRFRRSPRLVATVATIGLAQVLATVEIAMPEIVSGRTLAPPEFPTPFRHLRFELGGVIFDGDHIAILVVAGIHLGDVEITGWAPERRARSGLGRSFQDARLFPSLTVAETLAQGLERHLAVRDTLSCATGLTAVWEQEDDIGWTVADLVELMGLDDHRDRFVRELSTGVRRVVGLAMVLAHDPSVVLLDEPSSGIAQREAEALAPLLLRVRAETGCAMLVIAHDMPLISAVCDRLIALDLGRVIAEGTCGAVLSDTQVVSAYLGAVPAGVAGSHPADSTPGHRESAGAPG